MFNSQSLVSNPLWRPPGTVGFSLAHAYADSNEEELTCCVCFELFVNPHTPKDLNWPHVICKLCLKKLGKGGVIKYSNCHVITRLTKMHDVAAMRTNL